MSPPYHVAFVYVHLAHRPCAAMSPRLMHCRIALFGQSIYGLRLYRNLPYMTIVCSTAHRKARRQSLSILHTISGSQNRALEPCAKVPPANAVRDALQGARRLSFDKTERRLYIGTHLGSDQRRRRRHSVGIRRQRVSTGDRMSTYPKQISYEINTQCNCRRVQSAEPRHVRGTHASASENPRALFLMI